MLSYQRQDVTGLQFHVNADFFPSSDRKKIIFEADYQSEWNRAALAGAAKAVARDLELLPSLLGHSRLWEVIHSVGMVAREVQKGRGDEALAYFWEQLSPKIMTSKVFYTVQHEWCRAGDAVVLQNEKEEDAVPAMAALGIQVVHPDVRRAYYSHPFRDALGLQRLEAAHVVEALRQLGLNGRKELKRMPGPLAKQDGLRSLWKELDHLLGRTSTSKHDRDLARAELASCTLAPGLDGALWPCRNLFRPADDQAVALFQRLDPTIPFLDQAALGDEGEAVALMCPEFDASAAVEVLESIGEEMMREAAVSNRLVPDELFGWFETRIEEIRHSERLRERLRALSLYPTARGLQPLTQLSLPGNFQDPLGIADLVDVTQLGEHRDLLHQLGALDLSFGTYARDHIPRAFVGGRLTAEQKRDVLELLATSLGQIRDDPDLRRILSGIPAVECEDGLYRTPEDVYLRDELILSVLGDEVQLAVLPSNHQDASREFYRWVGVAKEPRAQDVVARVRALSERPPSENAVRMTCQVLAYLGKTFDEDKSPGRWAELRSLAWLPAMNQSDRWYRPDELHAVFQMYLFESQASFLDAPRPMQGECAKFLSYLGVRDAPSVDQIVDHLLWSIDAGKPPHKDIYRRLNDSSDDSAILRLLGTKCLLLDTGEIVGAEQVFWSEPALGRFRYRLSDSFRSYGTLLARLGVKDAPDHEDALKVLLEIDAEYGSTNSPIADEADYKVLIECWRRLSRALITENLTPSDLADLRQEKVVQNARRVLTRPDRIYFEDRAGLSAKFGRFLEGNVIPRLQEAWPAMRAAGVQDLGTAVTAVLVEAEQAIEDPTITSRLRERRRELARVFAAQTDHDSSVGILDRIADLSCLSVLDLKVQWVLKAFDREISSEVEAVAAHFHREEFCLYFVPSESQLPWSAIARELALAACPETEPGALAPGIKEVLSAPSLDEARRALDALGVRPLELAPESEPGESQVAAGFGGEERPSDGLGPEYSAKEHSSEDQPTKVSGPGDSTVDEETSYLEGASSAANKSETGEKTEEEAVEQPKNDKAYTSSGGKLRTYVVSEKSETPHEIDHGAARRRSEIEQAGVKRVLEYETTSGREPNEMPPLNPGYDIESRDTEGNLLRYIEVKSLRGTWTDGDAPALTRTQFERSEKEGEDFWLYVVERALAADFEIHCIQNPGRSVNQFIYDPGWRSLATETSRGADSESVETPLEV